MEEVENLIAELPNDEKTIVKRLRSIILETEPRLQERLSYGVPYFFHHRRVCFLWPISLLPAGHKLKSEEENTKVTFGLCYGNLLSNEQGLLQLGNRKQVALIQYTSAKEINEQAVREIIQEAVLVDEQFKAKKKKK
jgi:uncharacterized protein YdhG (YjbR/CyaY superfamily)